MLQVRRGSWVPCHIWLGVFIEETEMVKPIAASDIVAVKKIHNCAYVHFGFETDSDCEYLHGSGLVFVYD